jgi:hypothetical protein
VDGRAGDDRAGPAPAPDAAPRGGCRDLARPDGGGGAVRSPGRRSWLGSTASPIEATRTAIALAERRRRLGMGDPVVERALAARLARLLRRGQREADPEPPSSAGARGGTSGTRESVGRPAQLPRTQSRSGSNEQAIVRRSPARAFM